MISCYCLYFYSFLITPLLLFGQRQNTTVKNFTIGPILKASSTLTAFRIEKNGANIFKEGSLFKDFNITNLGIRTSQAAFREEFQEQNTAHIFPPRIADIFRYENHPGYVM